MTSRVILSVVIHRVSSTNQIYYRAAKLVIFFLIKTFDLGLPMGSLDCATVDYIVGSSVGSSNLDAAKVVGSGHSANIGFFS